VRPHDEQLDDWLGDVSDEDWSENAAERAARRRDTPAYAGLPATEPEIWAEPTVELAAVDSEVHPDEAHRQTVERRRLVAGLVVLGIVAVAVLIPVVLLRGGGETPATTVAEPSVTPTAPAETTQTPAEANGAATSGDTSTPPSESSSTSGSGATTPSTSGASGYTLPEGTKLRLGEGDPALVSQLQQALTSAGYKPGAVDGSFGEQTEAAVTAFQQDNGLSADGVVGPDTAAALNNALSG
jgi:hypothetical protein